MKQPILLIFVLFISAKLFAQTPQGINFQAVARNNSGTPIPSQNVTVKFRILQGSASGSSVFQETQNAATDACGMFNLKIGANSTPFSQIDWSTGSKWLEVSINNNIIGTTEMVSVPYALYAKKVEIESQTLSISGNTLSISSGNSVALPSGGQSSSIFKQEIPILRTINTVQNINYGSMTYSPNGNEVYINYWIFNQGYGIFEFKKDLNTGSYYYNRTINLSLPYLAFNIGLTLYNGELYVIYDYSVNGSQFGVEARKFNLTTNQTTLLTFTGSIPTFNNGLNPMYFDGNFINIYNNSNWQKYKVSGTTLVDNGVLINAAGGTIMSVYDNGEVLNYNGDLVKTDINGVLVHDGILPNLNLYSLYGDAASSKRIGFIRAGVNSVYLVEILHEIAANGNSTVDKMILTPFTIP